MSKYGCVEAAIVYQGFSMEGMAEDIISLGDGMDTWELFNGPLYNKRIHKNCVLLAKEEGLSFDKDNIDTLTNCECAILHISNEGFVDIDFYNTMDEGKERWREIFNRCFNSDEEQDDSMDGDHQSALASAGFGTDEDYGSFGED